MYEQLLTLRQDDHSIQEHFTILRALLDELDVYQHLTTDISRMKKYREELAVEVCLSSLNLHLCSQVRGQTWVPIVFQICRLPLPGFYGSPQPPLSLCQSTMVATHGRRRSTSRGGRGGHTDSDG